MHIEGKEGGHTETSGESPVSATLAVLQQLEETLASPEAKELFVSYDFGEVALEEGSALPPYLNTFSIKVHNAINHAYCELLKNTNKELMDSERLARESAHDIPLIYLEEIRQLLQNEGARMPDRNVRLCGLYLEKACKLLTEWSEHRKEWERGKSWFVPRP